MMELLHILAPALRDTAHRCIQGGEAIERPSCSVMDGKQSAATTFTRKILRPQQYDSRSVLKVTDNGRQVFLSPFRHSSPNEGSMLIAQDVVDTVPFRLASVDLLALGWRICELSMPSRSCVYKI